MIFRLPSLSPIFLQLCLEKSSRRAWTACGAVQVSSSRSPAKFANYQALQHKLGVPTACKGYGKKYEKMVKFETPGLQHDHGQCLVSSDFIRQSLDIGQLLSSSTCLLTSICFCSCMPALQTKCTAPGRHQAPGDDLNMFHVNALQNGISEDSVEAPGFGVAWKRCGCRSEQI